MGRKSFIGGSPFLRIEGDCGVVLRLNEFSRFVPIGKNRFRYLLIHAGSKNLSRVFGGFVSLLRTLDARGYLLNTVMPPTVNDRTSARLRGGQDIFLYFGNEQAGKTPADAEHCPETAYLPVLRLSDIDAFEVIGENRFKIHTVIGKEEFIVPRAFSNAAAVLESYSLLVDVSVPMDKV